MLRIPVPDRLETERLILRTSRVDDAAAYRQMWTERDPRVPPGRRVDADGRPTEADIGDQIASEARVGLLSVERREPAGVIGYCGLIDYGNRAPDEADLAYELLRSAQGHGYATEAGRAVVSWASAAGYQRLWAGVRDWNTPSRRVLDKLGFRESGQVEPDTVSGDLLMTVRDLTHEDSV